MRESNKKPYIKPLQIQFQFSDLLRRFLKRNLSFSGARYVQASVKKRDL